MYRLLFALALVALPLQAQQGPPAAQVVASGQAEVSVPPDQATLLLAVETTAPTAAEAGTANASRVQTVREALLRLGLPAAALSTTGYTVGPNTVVEQARVRQEGYSVSNAVQVRTAELSRIGAIVDAALAAGANRIQSVQFTSSRSPAARSEALARAVAQARVEARAMAEAAGGSLGELLELASTPGALSGEVRDTNPGNVHGDSDLDPAGRPLGAGVGGRALEVRPPLTGPGRPARMRNEPARRVDGRARSIVDRRREVSWCGSAC